MSGSKDRIVFQIGKNSVLRFNNVLHFKKSFVRSIFISVIILTSFLTYFYATVSETQNLFALSLYLLVVIAMFGILWLPRDTVEVEKIQNINLMTAFTFVFVLIILLNPGQYDLVGALGFPLDSALTLISLLVIYIFSNLFFTKQSQILSILFVISIIGVGSMLLQQRTLAYFALLIPILFLYSLSRAIEDSGREKVLYSLSTIILLVGLLGIFRDPILPIYLLLPAILFFVTFYKSVKASVPTLLSSKNKLNTLTRDSYIVNSIVAITYMLVALLSGIVNGFQFENIINYYQTLFETYTSNISAIFLGASEVLRINYPISVGVGISTGLIGLLFFASVVMLFNYSRYKEILKDFEISRLNYLWTTYFLFVYSLGIFLFPINVFEFTLWFLVLSTTYIGVKKKE